MSSQKQKKIALACIWAFLDNFLSNIACWLSPLNSTFLYQFGWPWSSFKVSVVWESNIFWTLFCCKFLNQLNEIKHGATTCWFVEAHAECVLHDWYQDRELYLCGFAKYTFNIGLHLDAYESLPLQLCVMMMIDTFKLQILIPVWMTLIFTIGHRVTRKLEFMQLFYWLQRNPLR